MLAFVAISRRVSPGRFNEHVWGRQIQWDTYLAKTRDVHLTIREAAARTGEACFSGSSALKGPIPGRSFAGSSNRRETRRCRARL